MILNLLQIMNDKMSEKISQISITGGGQILDQLKELLTGNLGKN